MQNFPHIGAAANHCHLPVNFQSIDFLDGTYQNLQSSNTCKQDQKRHKQLSVLPFEQPVHEKTRKNRVDNTEEIADQRRYHHEDDRGSGSRKAFTSKR